MDPVRLSRYIFETLQMVETLDRDLLQPHREKFVQAIQELGRGERFSGPAGWCLVPGTLDDLLHLLQQDLADAKYPAREEDQNHEQWLEAAQKVRHRQHLFEVAIHGLEFTLGLIIIHRPWARKTQ
jgi:hypothetical protein